MLTNIWYFTLLIFELIFLISSSIYTFFLIYSSIKGSPYVPTKNKEINFILKQANLKKNQLFFELGCGDGRLIRSAVKNYQVKGVGVDINPLLIFLASFLAKIQKLKKISFKKEDVLNVDFSQADVIYLFLMPALIKKLAQRFQQQLKHKTLIISHGFKIQGFEKYLIKTIDHKPFPTYFYLTK